MITTTIGLSVSGREITAYANFDLHSAPPAGATLLIGGIHGDEPAAILLLESFWAKFGPQIQSPVVVIPLANPDGFVQNTRYNANGVDINRNFGFNWSPRSEEPSGTAPWSEPETQTLRDLILRIKPVQIVSLHWALAEIDADGRQSTELAHRMWEALEEPQRSPYRLRVFSPDQANDPDCADFCPGSLGQWCGYGLANQDGGSLPAMITLELPYDPKAPNRPVPLPLGHLDRLKARWATDPAGYLEGVEEGVHRMLLAACAIPR